MPEDFRNSLQHSHLQEMFLDLARRITTLPEGKRFYNKTIKLFSQRADMIKTDAYDWAMGELMAYASLAKENYPVRLSGQDSERGTFSHRHAEIITEDGEEKYFPLKNLGGEHATVRVYNSPLNEYGVLGFEYGYSLANPFGLTIWEAQFGDFFNSGSGNCRPVYLGCTREMGRQIGSGDVPASRYEGQGENIRVAGWNGFSPSVPTSTCRW